MNGKLLTHNIDYHECSSCGYVQTEHPYWLGEAYADAINDSDTGIVVRNLANAKMVIVTLQALGLLRGRVVDYAGGYGLLVRLLRDYGIDALWADPHCSNLVARGFEYNDEPADLVTAFEAFEHFQDPSAELDRMLAIGRNIFLSTCIISDPAPAQDDWWYYGREHGQHIGFYRVRTLQRLAECRGRYFLSNGVDYHLISEKPVSTAYWNFMMRFNKYVTPVIRRKLVSKTWSDHEQQSRLM